MNTLIIQGDALQRLKVLPDASVQTCITSPPYWGLRDYKVRGQIGLEPRIELYLAHIVEVFREVRRVLKPDGTLWLNIGDSFYNGDKGGHHRAVVGKQATNRGTVRGMTVNRLWQPGLKPKDLCMIPARVALALQADGWYLRSEIVWHKTNPMPESCKDRPTKSHEYLYLLTKSPRYYCNMDAIKEKATGNAHDRARRERPDKWPNAWSAEPGRHDGIGNGRFTAKQGRIGREGPNSRMHQDRDPSHPTARKQRKASEPGSGVKYNTSFDAAVVGTVEFRNKRTVWTVPTAPFKGAHFATFPPKLIEPCVLAGSRPGDVVLDPFAGAMTTAVVAEAHGRRSIMIELSKQYILIGKARLAIEAGKARRALAA